MTYKNNMMVEECITYMGKYMADFANDVYKG